MEKSTCKMTKDAKAKEVLRTKLKVANRESLERISPTPSNGGGLVKKVHVLVPVSKPVNIHGISEARRIILTIVDSKDPIEMRIYGPIDLNARIH